MRALAIGAITWAKLRAEKGEPLDAERTLEMCESHENLRTAYEEALRRAAGHAYVAAMAEGGESIQVQELARERQDHAETRARTKDLELRNKMLADEVAQHRALIAVLTGVECMADGDGPCGVCMKCAIRGTLADGQAERYVGKNDVFPNVVDVDGYVEEKTGIRYLGKARKQPDGKYRCLADVGGALAWVEVTITIGRT